MASSNDRRFAVYLVLSTFSVLAIGLYALIGVMSYKSLGVPGELWQAAGAATGVLSGVLVSTKLTSGDQGQTTNVVAQTATVAAASPGPVEALPVEAYPGDGDESGHVDVPTTLLALACAVIVLFVAKASGQG
jgi:hypothetical protein